MSRILFLSLPVPGHTDFGGGSFRRTAARLASLGHAVGWATSFRSGWAQGFAAWLRSTGIAAVDFRETAGLCVPAPAQTIAADVRALARVIEQHQIGLLVGDRVCARASMAARLAGIPWAAVGTDGRQWSVRLTEADGQYTARPSAPDGQQAAAAARALGLALAHACLATDWLVSPYLDISFFPAQFWTDVPRSTPPQAHFVGAGDRTSAGRMDGEPRHTRIVVTFGNSLHPATARMLAALLPQVASRLADCSFVVLTGSARLTDELRATCLGQRVSVQTWADYSSVLAHASLSIGHGGTAHVWAAMNAGVPTLVVAPSQGDQTFNAARVVRLGLGETLEREALGLEPLVERIAALTRNQEVRVAVGRFQDGLRSGGGVAAAAALLDRLSSGRRPAYACAAAPCCCPLPANDSGSLKPPGEDDHSSASHESGVV